MLESDLSSPRQPSRRCCKGRKHDPQRAVILNAQSHFSIRLLRWTRKAAFSGGGHDDGSGWDGLLRSFLYLRSGYAGLLLRAQGWDST